MDSEKNSKTKLQTKINQRPSWIQNFFILCSGADRQILLQCPTEFNKYAGIGATIFFTALLASFSGGYALYTAFFDSVNAEFTLQVFLISASLGLLWGIIIFNLDRYIVLSLRKEKTPSKAEISSTTDPVKKKELEMDRKRILWNQILMATPRFLIALVIAITISRPIELRLFSPRIEKELESITQDEIKTFDDEFTRKIEDTNLKIENLDDKEKEEKKAIYQSNPIYNALSSKFQSKNSDIKIKDTQITGLDKVISANTISYFERDSFFDNNYKQWVYTNEKKYRLNDAGKKARNKKISVSKEINVLKTSIEELQKDKELIEKDFGDDVKQITADYKIKRQPLLDQIIQLNESYPQERIAWIEKNKKSSDLLSRLEALGKIADKSTAVLWASIVITLLFVLLETSPVVVKLLTKRGPYDEIIDRIEYEQYINEQQIISKYNMEINQTLKIAKVAAKLKGEMDLNVELDVLEEERRNSQKILQEVSKKREALSKVAIENWYINEMQKLQEESRKNLIKPKWKSLENQVWKNRSNGIETFYCFINKDENQPNKELWHRINGSMRVGGWQYLNNNTGIEINLSGQRSQFEISEINDRNFILQDINSVQKLEFTKVNAFMMS